MFSIAALWRAEEHSIFVLTQKRGSGTMKICIGFEGPKLRRRPLDGLERLQTFAHVMDYFSQN